MCAIGILCIFIRTKTHMYIFHVACVIKLSLIKLSDYANATLGENISCSVFIGIDEFASTTDYVNVALII